MNPYKATKEIPMKAGNFLFLRIATEYREISPMVITEEMRYAKEKLLCSVMDISKV